MIRNAFGVRALLLVLASGMPVAGGATDDLGRLFTTPGERAQLDESRRAVSLAPPTQAVVPQPQGAAPVHVEGAFTLRGLVKRDDGRSTAWVNDTNTYVGDLESPYRSVDKGGITADQVTLKLPDSKGPVKIKVGQTYEPSSMRIHELGAKPEPGAAVVPADAEAEADDE